MAESSIGSSITDSIGFSSTFIGSSKVTFVASLIESKIDFSIGSIRTSASFFFLPLK
ncbi:hypothetical protein ACQ9BO_07280 [Flavobacterium sp. P21]|uniref:hypothetical protein n=1 Tax=Flavobacterium sp. P21 TaxID=3423948 RepID=UPI003D66959C